MATDRIVDDEEMARAILEYLGEHRRAMDTLDGIAEWWIMRQQIRVTRPSHEP